MNPFFSIIIPTFNRASLLPKAIESAVAQTFSDWELIIVDDGSTDKTSEVAKGWLKKDARFKFIEQGNKGPSAARNSGIKMAQGIYILPLDADDRISLDYLDLAIKEFEVENPPKVVYCRAEFFGEKSGEWSLKPYSLRELALENMIFCSSFFKRSEWETMGGFDENMKDGWEDWEFWINLLKNGGEVKKINKVCFFYRKNKNSRNFKISETKSKLLLDYINLKHASFYINHFGNIWDNLKRQNKLENALGSKKHAINVLSDKIFSVKIFRKNYFLV